MTVEQFVNSEKAPHVILVDEFDNEIGLMGKTKAHQTASLHRAYSVFLFNDKGEMLLHQRSFDKYHSGGLWTNACCSHPQLGENILISAKNRLLFEMGIECDLTRAFTFIYKTDVGKDMTEHELDHVLIGVFNGDPQPNAEEVNDWQWLNMTELASQLQESPENFTEWFRIALPKVQVYIAANLKK